MAGKGYLYLLHFARPIGPEGGHQAQHYLGWARDPHKRIDDHIIGKGAAITAWCVAHGIDFRIVATWPGDRDDERIAKTNGHYARRCPECREEARARHRAWERARRGVKRG